MAFLTYRQRGRQPCATERECYRDMAPRKRRSEWFYGLEPTKDVSHGVKLFIQPRPLREVEGRGGTSNARASIEKR